MFKVILGRSIQAIPSLLLVSFAVFLLMHLIPGDPAVLMADGMSAHDIQLARGRLGLDKPLLTQYLVYMKNLLQGNLGYSFKTRRPVVDVIYPRIWPSMKLAFAAMMFSSLLGIFFGVLSGARAGGWFDTTVSIISLTGIAVPTFWSGLMLILLFSVFVPILPAFGAGSWKHLILPAITLGPPSMAMIARLTRSEILEVLHREFVQTAKSKGLSHIKIILKHVLPNAILPVLTFACMQFGVVLGYAVVVEAVFAWPGLGNLLIESLVVRDYPVVQGLILLLCLFFISFNVIADCLTVWLDPRLRDRGGSR